MRRLAVLLAAVVVAGCGSDAAPGNATARFLGPEADWCRCRLIVFYSRPDIGLKGVCLCGTGEAFFRDIRFSGGMQEKRYRLALAADEAKALRDLCIETDLVAVQVQRGPAIPDGPNTRLVLVNAAGERFEIQKLLSDNAPGVEKVRDALLALEARTKGLEPEFTGPYDWKWEPPKE